MADTLESFKRKQEQLAGWLDGAAGILGELGHASTACRVRNQARLAREFTFRIAVVGEFSSGKSTLLNAFLREELLPAKMPPCTAAPVSISYGPERRLLVHRAASPRPEERPFSELPSLVVLKANEDEEIARERAASDITQLEIQAPLKICQNRVSFYDTPGLNEAKARTEITLAMLPRVDAALVLVTATHLLSQTEREFLESEAAKPAADRRWMDNAFVAVTFADIAAADGGLDELRVRLDQFCDKLGVAPRRRYFVDPKSHLYRSVGKSPATDGLEFERLERDVADFVLRERGAAGWRSQLLLAQKAFTDATGMIEAEIVALTREADKVRAEADAARAALDTERERLDRMANAMRKVGKRFARDLTNRFRADASAWLDTDLAQHLAAKEYPETVIANVNKPARWYSERGTAWMRDQMQHWANEVPRAQLEEFLEEFEEAHRDDLADMKKNLEQIAGLLGLEGDASAEQESGLEWLFKAAAGLAAGGPLGACVGASLGWKGVLANFGVNFGLAIGAAVIGLSIPVLGWVAIAAAVAGAQLLLGQEGIKRRIRERVLESLRKGLVPKIHEAAEQVSLSAAEQVERVAQALVDSGTAVVTRMQEAAMAASNAAERDVAERELRMKRCADAKARLDALRAALEGAVA